MMYESESGWVEYIADDDSIRVGLHPTEGWYAVTGRYRPMSGESGEGRVSVAWTDLVGGVTARHLAEAFAP